MCAVEEDRRDDSQATRSMASPHATARDEANQETLAFSLTPLQRGQGAVATSGPARLTSQFGRYRILKRLGSGGMGAVYLAHDTQLDRQVALKVPHFRPEDGPESVERFYREARSAATIQHPNICPVFDVG